MHIQNFAKFCHFFLKILNGNEIRNEIKDNNSITNVRKIMCNNRNLVRICINAYTKFGEILSIPFQDIDGRDDDRNDAQPKSSIAPTINIL